MLRYLNIRDFVIVDNIELEFQPGFTVLTGETGAGKSILIDALALVLGGRGEGGVVRAGCERADLAAEFDVSRLPQVRSWLEANELGGDPGVCLLRRVIDQGGRSRGYINGHSATLQQMREAGESLVEIHGQHAHQSLLRQEVQRELLDDYGGLRAAAADVAECYRRWQALRQRRLAREKNARAFAAEREQLEWQVRELDALQLSPDGWQELLAEHGRLTHAATLLAGAEEGLELLAEGEMSLLPQLNGLIARLNSLVEFDAVLHEVLEVVEPAQIHLQEAAYALRHYLQRLEVDPERLRRCERKLEDIHGAARKYRLAPDQLPQLLEEARQRLAELEGEEDGGSLQQLEDAAQADYAQNAAALSAARRRAAAEFSRKVTETMQALAMEGGRFAIDFAKLAEGGAHGLERVEFRVTAHSGLPLNPLAKVASGGELSRISLAIQVIAGTAAAMPTLIFDEVDVGIGGGVAEIVGQLLQRLGAERQVLCITHLPQVAARGDQHWRVVKRGLDGVVLSQIQVLDDDGRAEEIARMLGGVEITATTRRHAEEMLRHR